jgi:carbon-monoxide dehydrogenase medium subunit
MIPSKFTYHKPTTIKDAIALLSAHGDNSKILAGGHSLIPVLKLRLNDPEHLIDITGIASVSGIRDNEKTITIGATATHAEIAANEAIQTHAPMIAQAAGMIGDIQVRNFGTIGGSIAHADPAADWPAVLLAANAQVVITNIEGSREVDIDQFFKGLFMTAMGDEEIITAIRIPKTAFNANSTYVKFPQPASRFALVGCAAAIANSDGYITEARVAFSGVSGTPFRDTNVEKSLKGQVLNEGSIATATASVADDVSVMSDHFAAEKYRKHLAAVYARKALSALS